MLCSCTSGKGKDCPSDLTAATISYTKSLYLMLISPNDTDFSLTIIMSARSTRNLNDCTPTQE